MKLIAFDPSISSRQKFNSNLGQMVCDFTFHWNERAGAWFCDFSTSEGANLSVRLIEQDALLGKMNRTGLKGDFRILRRNRMAENRITYDNFGTDWIMIYGTYEEWEDYDGRIRT